MSNFGHSPFLHPDAVHIMVDLETASTIASLARITSLAYVQFNFFNDERGDQYQVAIHPYGDPLSGKQSLHVVDDRDTLAWRFEHGVTVMEEELPKLSIEDALTELANRFVAAGWGHGSPEHFYMWSSKPYFDQAILDRHFDYYHGRRPWKYYQGRDVMTFVDTRGYEYRAFKHRVMDTDKWGCGDGLHDALNDCHFQIDILHEAIGIGKVLAGDNPPAEHGGG